MRIRYLLVCWVVLTGIHVHSQQVPVLYKGEMRALHRGGNALAAVQVDSILTPATYAVGPVAGLQGEIFVWEGRPFVAAVMGTAKKPFVKKDVQQLKAVFLVYAHVPAWDTLRVALSAGNMRQLELELAIIAARHGMDTLQPFPFLLLGEIASGKGHIVFADVPTAAIEPGSIERYKHFNSIQQQKAQLVGFYSQQHAGIYTHHNSYLHIHYRMYNKYQAGHLDEVAFDGKTTVLLLLPRTRKDQ